MASRKKRKVVKRINVARQKAAHQRRARAARGGVVGGITALDQLIAQLQGVRDALASAYAASREGIPAWKRPAWLDRR